MTSCKNCGAPISGKYCSACGQKVYTEKDKSVKHLLEEGLHFITHFEGTFFTTLKAVLRHPGRITADYADGIRKKYFKPLSFYLLIVVIYLVFPVARGLNMDMKYYKGLPFVGRTVAAQIDAKTQQRGTTEEALGEHFLEKSHSTSKLLLFLLVPLSAMVVAGLYRRKNLRTFDYFILGTEINIIYLLVFYLLLPVLYFLVLAALRSNGMDDEVLGLSFTLLFGLYAARLFWNFFKSNWGMALLKGMLFAVVHAFVLLPIYKFCVFEATILMV